ncbi:MAG: sphingosine kinase [Spirochaetales bacterium]|nr:sphingosine kinase [Spirochaetales bacterium]
MKEKTKKAFHSCAFIINPSRYPEYAKILKKILRRSEVPFVRESTSKEHFIELVRDFCRSDYRYLLVWGGDGTAHDAINTVTSEMEADPEIGRKKSLGFLRGGSGNGIQDSYEVPVGIRKQIETYADSMNNSYVVDVDLLETSHGNRRSYCQLVGIGFDANLLRRRQEKRYRFGKKHGLVRTGMFAYIMAGLSTFQKDFRSLSREFTLTLYDGKFALRGVRVNAEFPLEYLERKVSPVELEAGTRPYYGKLFKICPDVVCNDGFLDLYIYNFDTRLTVLQNVLWLWKGRHDIINRKFAKGEKPLIERYEVTRAEISATEPFDYHIDGEIVRTTEKVDGMYVVNLRIVPQRLSFLVPGAFYRKFHPF